MSDFAQHSLYGRNGEALRPADNHTGEDSCHWKPQLTDCCNFALEAHAFKWWSRHGYAERSTHYYFPQTTALSRTAYREYETSRPRISRTSSCDSPIAKAQVAVVNWSSSTPRVPRALLLSQNTRTRAAPRLRLRGCAISSRDKIAGPQSVTQATRVGDPKNRACGMVRPHEA
jgi:hypothetical protein